MSEHPTSFSGLFPEKQPEQSYGWLTACDEAMICAHLGVANLSDSYESAKAKLNSLIDWNIAVATDPAVNGGFSLQPEQSEPKSKHSRTIPAQ